MSALTLDGKKLAAAIAKTLAPRAAALKKKRRRAVTLAIVADDGAADSSYRIALAAAASKLGIDADVHRASADDVRDAASDAAELVAELGADAGVDAVLIDHPNAAALASALPAAKDPEGLTAENYGRLFLIKSYDRLAADRLIAPCTALAVAELVRSTNIPLAGKRAVVVGRSAILGRPAAHLLSSLDLTVALCHGKTRDLQEEVSRADVVVAGLGKPGFIKGAWIKKDAIVVDAGVTSVGGKLRGDVEASAKERAAYLTPVPGGVGPVTTMMLLGNVLTLAERAR